MFHRALPVCGLPVAALAARLRHASCEECERIGRSQSVDRRSGRNRGWSAAPASQPAAPPAAASVEQKHYNALRLGIGQLRGNVYIEDRYVFDEVFRGYEPLSMLSVFDGHGGWQVARYLEDQLPRQVRKQLAPGSAHVDAAELKRALRQAYIDLDENLGRRMRRSMELGFDRFARVGSCGITAVVTSSHIVVANAGDCQAVLVSRGGRVQELNVVHNVNNEAERKRVRALHPEDSFAVQCTRAFLNKSTGVSFESWRPGLSPKETDCYIKGVLNPSRAFGDFALKRDDMNIDLRTKSRLIPDATSMPYITAEPEVVTVPRSPNQQFLVLGSDGLFDELTPKEVAKIVSAEDTPQAAADRLLQEAKQRALSAANLTEEQYQKCIPTARRDIHDDITVLVYFLSFPQAWIDQWSFLSNFLQDCIDYAFEETLEQHPELAKFKFSACLADPSLQDCPLVAVSDGFEALTGYGTLDAIGRNCRFLSYGVPDHLDCAETSSRLRAYTRVAITADPYSIAEESVATPSWVPEGSAASASYFVRWNRRKDGELFRNLFVLRQIWLGDRPLILALQTKIDVEPSELAKSGVCQSIDALVDLVSSRLVDQAQLFNAVLSPT